MAFFPEFKSRRLGPFPTDISYQKRANGFASWGAVTKVNSFIDEDILSQCHSGTWPPSSLSKARDDVGGFMDLHRSWTTHPETSLIDAGLTRGRIGLAQMLGYTYGTTPATPGSLATLNAFGTSAIARCLPTNPNSSLSTALGELKKDGLPTLPGSSFKERAGLARSAGHEFLNIEFGWLPLINDIRLFADSVMRSRVLVDQYLRDSDQKIRRRFVPQPVVHAASVFTGTGLCYGQNIFAPNSTVTKTLTERYWFHGAFRYHIPMGDDFYSRLLRYEALSARLFDTRLTPELLWNLAPWSWAVDWFTNMGDVIHNISRLGSDGLVMQYGYAMRHNSSVEYHRGRYSFSDSKGTHSGTVAREIGSEYKKRVRANPYGFGIDDSTLTGIQLAILAALGLTRGQRNR